MSNTLVTDLLASRSSEEKRMLLVHLLRELVDQSPSKPISIEDANGKLVGLFSPTGPIADDDFFVEGSPRFYQELERRRRGADMVSAEDALRYLQGEPHAKP